MKVKTLMAVGFVMAAVVPSFAGAGGFGGFGGPLGALQRPAVQADLKLTDEQKGKLDEVRQQIMQEGQGIFQGLQNATPEERAKKLAEFTQLQYTKLGTVLKPEQIKRLREVVLQIDGLVGSIMQPAVGEKLKITDEQRQKVGPIVQGMQQARREIFQSIQNGGSREEAQKKTAELTKSTDEKIIALLTDDQKKTWKEMSGEPLKLA